MVGCGPIIGPEHACTERGKGPQVQEEKVYSRAAAGGQGTRAAPFGGPGGQQVGIRAELSAEAGGLYPFVVP